MSREIRTKSSTRRSYGSTENSVDICDLGDTDDIEDVSRVYCIFGITSLVALFEYSNRLRSFYDLICMSFSSTDAA